MYYPFRKARGFTLVELLVVIGIIAVLISLLLPSLNKARAQANAAKCLSNLRNIGQAINMYAAEFKGFLVPGHVANDTGGGSGLDNYATILVGLKYLPAPEAPTVVSDQDSVDDGASVFRCPEGLPNKHESGGGNPWPTDVFDTTVVQNSIGLYCWRRESTREGAGGIMRWLDSSAKVDTWYGINGLNTVSDGTNAPANFPFQKLKVDAAGVLTGKFTKVSTAKNAADLAIMYDGLRWLDGGNNAQPGQTDRNHVSFRHSGGKIANVLFADSHCEMMNKSQLPNLTDAQIKDKVNGVASLKPWPHPHWRMDQR